VVRRPQLAGAVRCTDVEPGVPAEVGGVRQQGAGPPQHGAALRGPVRGVQPGQALQGHRQLLAPVARPGLAPAAPHRLGQVEVRQADRRAPRGDDRPVDRPQQPRGVAAQAQPGPDRRQLPRVLALAGLPDGLLEPRDPPGQAGAGVAVEDPAGAEPGDGQGQVVVPGGGPGHALAVDPALALPCQQPAARGQQVELAGAHGVRQHQRMKVHVLTPAGAPRGGRC
jgi:hypothetical protein